jgi:peptidoglycan/LPS O-acetylase OafA/YrhL
VEQVWCGLPNSGARPGGGTEVLRGLRAALWPENCAYAALLVWWDHYVRQRSGNLGVEIFFVLSGFLITTLLLRELAKTGTVSLRGFYRRRARRILPAFYVFWVVAVAVQVYHNPPLSTGALASTFFYFSNYHLSFIHPVNHRIIGHTWSLAVEEQFYLLWPVLFLVFDTI